MFKPFPNDKFRLFKTQSLQTAIFKFEENSSKFSKRVENTVGKDLHSRHIKTMACLGKG